MIGIGTWEATISVMFQKFTGKVEVIDNNGEYDFRIELPDKLKKLKISYYDIQEVGNDTLTGKGEIAQMPGKTVEVRATFKGDKMEGFAKMAGVKVNFKNGHRVK